MKCLQCGYQNKPESNACNLCGTIFRKEKKPAAGNAGNATVEMKGPASKDDRPTRSVPRIMAATPPPPSESAMPMPSLLPPYRLETVGSPPVALRPGVEITIGRQPGSGLQIPSTRVSRLHAVIRWEGDQPILADKGSSNGTFVRGKRIKEHALKDGDEIEIGPFLCVYRCGDARPLEQEASEVGDRTQTIAAGGDLFTGTIGESGLMEVLGGLEFNKKTGTLDVFGKGGDGWLTLKGGLPLAAKANGKVDEEAVFELLGMKQGRYTFTPELDAQEKKIKGTITALLLEWGRRADESLMRDTQSD